MSAPQPHVLVLSGIETVGLFVLLPAVLFGVIALIVLLASRPASDQSPDFPRLRPPGPPVDNDGLHAGQRHPTPGSADGGPARHAEVLREVPDRQEGEDADEPEQRSQDPAHDPTVATGQPPDDPTDD